MATPTAEATAPPVEKKASRLPDISFDKIIRSPAFWPGVAMAAGIALLFWSLLAKLPSLWLEGDGYYSHGFLVPGISAYVIWKWWPKLSQIQPKPGWIALLFMAPVLFIVRAAYLTDIQQALSVGFIATILLGIWFVAGFRWALALVLPVGYLFFALPVWTGAIDNYTNPLQIISSDIAYAMLDVGGFQPYQDSPTIIHLNNFTLDVGVPCSGLKLILAVTAFTFFFMMIGGLKWWGNLIMLSMILPLCLFINGLRIALIGVVGDMYGKEAGHQFHDYSGYVTLIICFFILFKIARLIGWKD